jgi:hypothetical protein
MNVAGYQYLGMDCAPVLERGLAQFLQIVAVVASHREAGRSIVAALDNMLGDVGKIDSGLPSHA